MRFIYTLTLASILSFFGCDQKSEIISFNNADGHSKQLVKLPPKQAGLSVETVFSVTETIKGDKGGELKLKETYKAEDGHKVKIDVKLKIKKNSFIGESEITLTVDDEFAAISITPNMVFDKPIILDAKFEGVEVESIGLASGDYDFVFIDHNGNIQLVSYNKLKVDEKKGKLSVNHTKIKPIEMEIMLTGPNSRYGFVN